MPRLVQTAFVLHRWPYRDTSLLVDFFTRESGRIRVVFRGARSEQGKRRQRLQWYQPLQITYSGRGDLFNLLQIEPHGRGFYLVGQSQVIGLYLNELLVKLLPHDDSFPELFDQYQKTLESLALRTQSVESILRGFEKVLITQLGYGINFLTEAGKETPIQPDFSYEWVPQHGFQRVLADIEEKKSFLGAHLLAMHANEWDNGESLKSAKQLFQLILNELLHGKLIVSRSLWISEERS